MKVTHTLDEAELARAVTDRIAKKLRDSQRVEATIIFHVETKENGRCEVSATVTYEDDQ